MVAKLQRLIVLSLLVASMGCVLIGLATQHPAIGIAAAALLIFGYSLILAAELVCMCAVEPAASRPGAVELIRAWWGETVAAAKVFFWRQPFRAHAEPDNLEVSTNDRRGVLLVHGLVCNRGFWNPLARQFRQLGIPTLAIDLEPIFTSIDSYSQVIDAAVRRLEAATSAAPVIVAHSMGGLAVRHWLASWGGNGCAHRVITIGTPHRGTWLARFGKGPSGQQMAIGSDWLAALDRATASAAQATQFTCFYGNCDNVVFPSAHGCLDGAENRLIGGRAHVAMAFHPDVFAEVLRWIKLPTPHHSNRSPGSTTPASSSPSNATRP